MLQELLVILSLVTANVDTVTELVTGLQSLGIFF